MKYIAIRIGGVLDDAFGTCCVRNGVMIVSAIFWSMIWIPETRSPTTSIYSCSLTVKYPYGYPRSTRECSDDARRANVTSEARFYRNLRKGVTDTKRDVVEKMYDISPRFVS